MAHFMMNCWWFMKWVRCPGTNSLTIFFFLLTPIRPADFSCTLHCPLNQVGLCGWRPRMTALLTEKKCSALIYCILTLTRSHKALNSMFLIQPFTHTHASAALPWKVLSCHHWQLGVQWTFSQVESLGIVPPSFRLLDDLLHYLSHGGP